MRTPFQPSGIRLGIARGVSYGLFGPPDQFVATGRELGAGLVRLYVYWSQVEPAPGRWDWTIVDAFLAQLTGDEEVWVTVCSSSTWATRQPTDFLPSSPAHDDIAFSRFVHALVGRCADRVQYWQCNNEPSNVGLLWAGTAAQYVAQLELFHQAVRGADPGAAVVLGGCGYDVLSASPGEPPQQFFDHVLAHGRDLFDVFALHLYDDPALIPSHIETVREMMRVHGYERPVVVGEYNGPTLFQLPQVESVLHETMARAFANAAGGDGVDLSTGELAASANVDTPERRAMKALYAKMADLPPQLQMLMAGCPRELEERRHRINCREIVSRNLLALSAGVKRTVCWHLAPEVPNYDDPFTMMELLQGKLLLLRYDDRGRLGQRQPAANTFRLLADQLDGAETVTRSHLDQHPGVYAFAVERPERGQLLVLWKDGDVFSGEDEPPALIDYPWPHGKALAIDALGTPQRLDVQGGQVQLPIGVTPIFITPHASAKDMCPGQLGYGDWSAEARTHNAPMGGTR
jgi:hypothetical protein